MTWEEFFAMYQLLHKFVKLDRAEQEMILLMMDGLKARALEQV